jgi:membrane fusion protein (multidrug efflux system)
VDPIWVRFSLSESDLAKIPAGRVGRTATNDVQLILGDGTRYPAKGRINFTATQIDPKLGTQQLRAEFDNPREQLVPGQFVRVRIVAAQQDNVFLVPQTAVMQTEKGKFLFVDNNGKADIRPVETGEWSGTNWIIRSGLKAGDRVIVDNLLKLRPGAPIAVAPVDSAPVGAAPGAAPAKAASAADAAPSSQASNK